MDLEEKQEVVSKIVEEVEEEEIQISTTLENQKLMIQPIAPNIMFTIFF